MTLFWFPFCQYAFILLDSVGRDTKPYLEIFLSRPMYSLDSLFFISTFIMAPLWFYATHRLVKINKKIQRLGPQIEG